MLDKERLLRQTYEKALREILVVTSGTAEFEVFTTIAQTALAVGVEQDEDENIGVFGLGLNSLHKPYNGRPKKSFVQKGF